MREIKRTVGVLLVGAMAAVSSAHGALIDRGNGLIYDTVLKVTWMQDVALAQTLGTDSDGIFDWFGAKAWANQLVYGGFDDWRLPTLKPINGIEFERTFHCDGSSDYGYGVAAPGSASAGFIGNELAYMFHVNLGNQSRCTGPGPNLENKTYGPDVGIQNASFVDAMSGDTVSFLNLQDLKESFWHDLAPGASGFTWAFKYTGFNDWDAAFQLMRAWAVRDGDVTAAPPPSSIPEPSTLLLLSALLPGLWWALARRRARQPASLRVAEMLRD